jgi:hypothetical protein
VEPFIVEATKSTPFIQLDANAGLIRIQGESFPENAAKFYGPVFSWLTRFLAMDGARPVVIELRMGYFNSSSSKALLIFFDLLEDAARSGREVVINWQYDAENELSREFGEEFRQDLEAVEFNLVRISGGHG